MKSRTGHSGPHAFLNLLRKVQRRSARVTNSHDPSWSRANLLHWSQCTDLRRLQTVVASGSVADRGAALHQCLFEARLFERVAFCRQCARMVFSSGGRFSHVDCLHHAWFCSAAAQIDTDQAGVFDVYLMDGIIIQLYTPSFFLPYLPYALCFPFRKSLQRGGHHRRAVSQRWSSSRRSSGNHRLQPGYAHMNMTLGVVLVVLVGGCSVEASYERLPFEGEPICC